jgi:transketolase
MVYETLIAAETLQKDRISARVINLHTPKPIDKEAIIKAAKETGAVVTVEEHTIAGGMGSAVAEVLAQEWPVPVRMIGIRDRFGVSGEPDELFEYFGLKAENIVKAAREALRLKR